MIFHEGGYHHANEWHTPCTALTSDAQKTVDFYAGILGLRLVKRTVNFDDPETYHLYFGNEVGSPGTAVTFFPYEGSRKGRIGGGQVAYTSYAVPEGALDFWRDRLKSFGIEYTEHERFGEEVLRFSDWDGLQIEIVERAEGAASKWSFGGIGTEQAIKGFGGALLYSTSSHQTMRVLEDVLGFERHGEENGIVRFVAPGDIGNTIDVSVKDHERGLGGHGTVHHIAWRAKDGDDQMAWRERVAEAGLEPTSVADRNYFTSIYFRERGGILFEIATDTPGFTVDEPMESLGERLMLPAWYEKYRERIESGLPDITVRELEANPR